MVFLKESFIRSTPERVFGFHEQPDALLLLIPPWEKAVVIQSAAISKVGSRAIIETKVLGPIAVRWIAEHSAYDPPHFFEDVQVKGPFRFWRHRHLVQAREDGAVLRDEIEYEPPLGFIGRMLSGPFIENRLRRLFDYRHEVTRKWCEAD
jgi:hypothetical protein